MAKSIQYNDTYIDTTGVAHNKELLSDILNTTSSKINEISSKIDEISLKISEILPKRTVGYNTSGARWTRFVRVTLNQSWNTCNIAGYLNGTVNCTGAGNFYMKLYTQQLPAFSNVCYVGAVKGDFTADRIKGVVVSSSTTQVVVDFYIYTVGPYRPYSITLTSYDSKVDFKISENQVSTLPSGTVISFS